MANFVLLVNPVDTLSSVEGVSLHPTTIRAISMEVKSPEKFMEAKSIVDNWAELLDTEFWSFAQSLGIDLDPEMKDKEKLQERRPGLGCRRAQFTFKLEDTEKEIKGLRAISISSISENDIASILSQETLEQLGDQSSVLSQDPHGKDDVEFQVADLIGSTTDKDNKLQEQLQIKPIELGSLCIPDFSVTEKTDDQLNPVEVGSYALIPQHPNEKAKRPARGRHECKALSSLASLTDAGTPFETGARRSKQQKTRPLEFWKGEKLLYARVGESVKLVGLRYVSPTQGSLKVKSYMSDEYKDVIALTF